MHGILTYKIDDREKNHITAPHVYKMYETRSAPQTFKFQFVISLSPPDTSFALSIISPVLSCESSSLPLVTYLESVDDE